MNAVPGRRVVGLKPATKTVRLRRWIAGSPFSTGKSGSTSVAVDPAGRFVYATNQFAGDNDISQHFSGTLISDIGKLVARVTFIRSGCLSGRSRKHERDWKRENQAD